MGGMMAGFGGIAPGFPSWAADEIIITHESRRGWKFAHENPFPSRPLHLTRLGDDDPCLAQFICKWVSSASSSESRPAELGERPRRRGEG